jgi:16S rRNA (cytosine967-C5)-methyltransferase
VSLDVLGAVLRRGRALDEALDGHSDLAHMEARDRAFVRNLTATALRRKGQIDALLAGFLERPPPPKAAAVTDILRLGAAQILFFETAAHAAVDTAVNLTRARRQQTYAGLVNAVLRRLVRDGPALRDAQDAARLNTPDWLWDSWTAAYGEATCRRIAEAHLAEPPLDLSFKGDADGWAAALEGTRLPTGSLRLYPRGPIPALPGFAEGAWWVQDAAAALPARLLGPVAGRTVLDLCAAPGGKAAQLAAAGARVTAVDRAQGRVARLRANLTRLGLEVETVIADAVTWRPDAPADAVLLDVPCSATGTLRRHPDAAWLRTADDVKALGPLQQALLEAAIAMVRPGGAIVYCACSLQPEEGPGRVDALIGAGAPVARQPIGADEVGGLAELITPAGDLRTFPFHLGRQGGMDGFFAARLLRR